MLSSPSRVPRRRQADQGVARRRSAAGGRALLLPRGLGGQARVRLSRPQAPPLGVCGQIIPWNFPLLMAAWKLAPALACGNTVVLKPAPNTPLTALRLAQICQEAELPRRRREYRHRRGRHRRRARRHPTSTNRVHRSTEVGKAIIASAGDTQKNVTLELGGKSPTSYSKTPISTRRSRASSMASTSTRATFAAPARACSCRSRLHEPSWGQAKRGGSALYPWSAIRL